eukprot:scaffold97418_cov29-Tisochrysis_lutea.AAC.4
MAAGGCVAPTATCCTRAAVLAMAASAEARGSAERSREVIERIRSSSSPKPASNMVSTSSIMTWRTSPRYTIFLSRSCSSRPGVATSRSTGRSSCRPCGPNGVPPCTTLTDRRRYLPSVRPTSCTCSASSRVGTRTSARGRFGRARLPAASSSALRVCMMGTK